MCTEQRNNYEHQQSSRMCQRERWQRISSLQILEQLEQTGANGLRGLEAPPVGGQCAVKWIQIVKWAVSCITKLWKSRNLSTLPAWSLIITSSTGQKLKKRVQLQFRDVCKLSDGIISDNPPDDMINNDSSTGKHPLKPGWYERFSPVSGQF